MWQTGAPPMIRELNQRIKAQKKHAQEKADKVQQKQQCIAATPCKLSITTGGYQWWCKLYVVYVLYTP